MDVKNLIVVPVEITKNSAIIDPFLCFPVFPKYWLKHYVQETNKLREQTSEKTCKALHYIQD